MEGLDFIDMYVVGFLSAVGVTNQRETTLVWDKETGEPLYNAIGWCIMDLSQQVSHVFGSVCLSVCEQNYRKTTVLIFIKPTWKFVALIM